MSSKQYENLSLESDVKAELIGFRNMYGFRNVTEAMRYCIISGIQAKNKEDASRRKFTDGYALMEYIEEHGAQPYDSLAIGPMADAWPIVEFKDDVLMVTGVAWSGMPDTWPAGVDTDFGCEIAGTEETIHRMGLKTLKEVEGENPNDNMYGKGQ
jgi:hypothetical protein